MPILLVQAAPPAAVAPAPAEDANPAPSVVVPPDWVHKPNADDLLRVYPSLALRERVQGVAIFRCEVSEKGTLFDCAVVDEAPKGRGFGEAALKLAPQFKMRPLTKAGQPVAGGTVRIPIRFILPH